MLAVAFLGSGARALSGGDDRLLQLWDSAQGAVTTRFQARAAVKCLAAAPDGRRAVTGGGDGTLRYWGLPEP